jgi:iron complex transport system permease protein
MVLLLAGVTLTALLSAVIRFVQYLADFTETFQTMRWMMGSLDVASYVPIVAALVAMAIAWVGFATLPRVLNLMSVGADSAAARGVDVTLTERVALVSASWPPARRSRSRTGGVCRHHRAAPGQADRRRRPSAGASCLGAVRRHLLIVCDLAARTVFAPLELPVGIVTAMVGGPVFLWLLLRRA